MLIQIFSLSKELVNPKAETRKSHLIIFGVLLVLIHFGIRGRIVIAGGIRQAANKDSFSTKGGQKVMASTEKNTINIVDKENAPIAKRFFSEAITEADASEWIDILNKCCGPDFGGG